MFGLGSKNEAALLRVIILSLIALIAFSTRLFSVIRYESVIHEFDPWFNYRTTQRIISTGFYDFINWFDDRSWYPLGRVVGGTVYPGLMLTAALIHKILHFFNIPVDIRNVCVFFAPFSLDDTAGLLAAIFLGIAPGYISRSVAGSYDNEGISIFLLVFTFYLWIKAVKLGSALWACLAAIFYFYMVSAWGGYVYIINTIPLHAFTLILMGRYSSRLYVSYSTFYVIGTIGSMQVPFVGFQPTRTSEHMAALGVFGLMQLVAFAQFLRSHISEKQVRYLLYSSIAIIIGGAFIAMVALTYAGYIAPWTGRFYSLWDTEYAKKYIPIIASVSEHQPTAWSSMFFDLQYLLLLFPAGVYFCIRTLRDEHVFVAIYALTSAYFAGVMVRLVLTLTPVVCFAAAIAITQIFDYYLDWASAPPSTEVPSKDAENSDRSKAKVPGIVTRFEPKVFITGAMLCLSVLFVYHCTWVTSSSYSSPSIVLSTETRAGDRIIIDDFREAYYWLRKNTHEDAKILAWWDYGYQIAGMSNRTVIVDNNTWNNTHIATVGKVMASDEDTAYVELRRLNVDYVLVIFGGMLGYSGDDINKFLWMVRIAQGVYPDQINEASYFTSSGRYSVGDDAPATFRNSVMYKLSYYGFNEISQGAAMDRVRHQTIASAPIQLHTMEEAYTTAHWMVRIYKVLPPDNLGRPLKDAATFKLGKAPIPKLKRRKKRTVS
ncbi:oligosaccharyl transferase stt3 subunit [Massospora cicadina]|nr:oligosaccharyl transferase stt3 subunit [Massospora cicadina]